jgi:serine/threonine-protein phosphatase 4 regulatory subunit 1
MLRLNKCPYTIGQACFISCSQVRQAACTSLVSLASLFRLDDIGQHVLTIILRLAHEDDKEESRMTAAELLNSLAETLGTDLCKQFVIPEVVSLAEDPAFRVRKATALNFHYVCKTGGEHELFERLMPAFVRLSKDDMFRVRRACAESLSEISKYVSDDIRIGVLVEIFLRLAQDQYKVVKQSVLQQSGMFISTLPCQYVNENILSQFSCMANSPFGDAQLDLELKHYCAFSFPAVLLTVGSGRWKTVRPLYQALVKCNSPSVKQTLAASLHEIAKILGNSSLVEEELLPVFEQFIQVHITTLVVIFYLTFCVL